MFSSTNPILSHDLSINYWPIVSRQSPDTARANSSRFLAEPLDKLKAVLLISCSTQSLRLYLIPPGALNREISICLLYVGGPD